MELCLSCINASIFAEMSDVLKNNLVDTGVKTICNVA